MMIRLERQMYTARTYLVPRRRLAMSSDVVHVPNAARCEQTERAKSQSIPHHLIPLPNRPT
jgi:hypothetical protein